MNEITTSIRKNLQVAKFTYFIVVYSFFIFIGIKVSENQTFVTDSTLTKFGAPTAIEIFGGKYWGVVTNSFVHFQIWHLFINLFATLLIASYVERRIGFWKLFGFGLIASMITSSFQVSLSNDAGIGLSGVNYALFGFIFGKTFIDQRFKIVTKNLALIVMILFIPFSELMNRYYNWNIATVALTSGLLFGFFFSGLFTKFKTTSTIILASMILFSVFSIFNSPWSAEWNCSKAMRFHEKMELKEAKKYYSRAISINPESQCANDNLLVIKIAELSKKALTLHEEKKYVEAGKVYDEILKLDSQNSWALENKSRLP